MKSGTPRKDRKDAKAAIASALPSGDVLTTTAVARMLRVSASTVARWAREGKIRCHFTLGGHRRFERAAIEALGETVDRLGGWSETAPDRGGRSPSKAKKRRKRKVRSGA